MVQKRNKSHRKFYRNKSSLVPYRQSKGPPLHVHRAPLQAPRRLSPGKSQKPLNVVAKVQESPKVINFEDRLKSIITSVLNEDQEQRKASRLEVNWSFVCFNLLFLNNAIVL